MSDLLREFLLEQLRRLPIGLSAMRIRVRINGSSHGVVLMIEPESTGKKELVNLAARKLELEVADQGKAVLYMDGDDRVEVDELEKNDIVYVAFNGSPYKDKQIAIAHPAAWQLV